MGETNWFMRASDAEQKTHNRILSCKCGLACSRRSDSEAGAKNIASERAGKKGRLSIPLFFPLFHSLYHQFSLALHYLNAWNRLSVGELIIQPNLQP